MLKKNSRKSWLLGLSAAVLLIAICGLYFRKAQFSATELVRTRISATNGFEELTALQVNGITQWLLARTRNANAPILLKLHGGPCSASMPFARTIDEPYLDTFIVVHWDQRACGKSFNLLHPFVSASISDRVADLDIVVGYLIEKYKRRNLILIAESYGTMFGPQYVAAHPEKIAAYIGIGQVYDEIATEQVRYNYLKAAAISRNDSESVAALGRLTFPHGVSDLIILNNELYKCRCGLFRHPHGGAFAVFSYDLGHLFKSPEYSFLDAFLYEPAMYLISARYMHEILSFRMPETALKFRVPIFLISGKYDYMTPIPLSRIYFQKLEAPKKEFIEVPNAAHMVGFDAQAELARIVNSIPERLTHYSGAPTSHN